MLSKKHQASNEALIKKTIEDPAFREALIKDPKAAIQEKFNIEIPSSKKINVHVNGPDEVHYVIPPVMDKDLTDEELDAVAGGNLGAWSCCCHPCLAQCS